jgi:hypothetical protein
MEGEMSERKRIHLGWLVKKRNFPEILVNEPFKF